MRLYHSRTGWRWSDDHHLVDAQHLEGRKEGDLRLISALRKPNKRRNSFAGLRLNFCSIAALLYSLASYVVEIETTFGYGCNAVIIHRNVGSQFAVAQEQ